MCFLCSRYRPAASWGVPRRGECIRHRTCCSKATQHGTVPLVVRNSPCSVLAAQGANKDLLINILLTLLGYIPGIIHAIYIIASTPKAGRGI